MMAFSRFSNPLDTSVKDFVLFDFLRTVQNPSKRLGTKTYYRTSKIENMSAKTTPEVSPASSPVASPKLKKNVRFNETVQVRTFRLYPVERSGTPPLKLDVRIVSDVVAAPEVEVSVTESTKENKDDVAVSSLRVRKNSFEQSPYFKSFQTNQFPPLPC